MNEGLIQLGLQHDPDAADPQDDPAAVDSESSSLNARLLALISETAVESESLNTPQFRARLENYRRRLESSVEGDPDTATIANECLRLCQDYLGRARTYLLERETELAEVIEVMRVAIGKLAGDAKAFNGRLIGSSERLNRLTEIHDIRELKKRICQEVQDLNRAVEERQKQDEMQFAKLSKHIEVLQASLTISKHEASIDQLTRIANRGSFDRAFERWLAEHTENQEAFILAILDIDNFKEINDKHGHPVGDRVLFCAAQWLAQYVRSTDVLARYGGEEFVVLMADIDAQQAETHFSDLLAKISHCNYAYDKNGEECTVAFTASCGLAEFTLDESGEDLIRRADEALYVAKRTGKNQVVLAKTEKSLWNSLKRALPRTVKSKS
jgi:diguanylate cyclase